LSVNVIYAHVNIRLKNINRKINNTTSFFIKANKITCLINGKRYQMCWQYVPMHHQIEASAYVFSLVFVNDFSAGDAFKIFNSNRLIIFIARPKLPIRSASIERQVKLPEVRWKLHANFRLKVINI